MTARNATVAVIGAGDFIGAAIARKFAAEGFTVFAGRRNGDKLAPLIADIQKSGGKAFGRSLDARKEDDITAFLQEADRAAPLEVCIFNIGANVNFPILDTTELGGGRPYLVGDRFSSADMLLTTCLVWAVNYGVPVPPVCTDYTARIAQRPAYQAALRANLPPPPQPREGLND